MPRREVAVDGLRLCLGTLTVLPTAPPARLTSGRAATAMVLAPAAGVLVGLAAGGVTVVASAVGLPGLVCGVAAVATGAAATRALHLDGVADTADGMAAIPHGGDPQRALDVMRRGDVGPAGVVALVLLVVSQAGLIGELSQAHSGWRLLVTVVLAWAVSRAVLPLLCSRLFAAARPGGLGAAVLRTVPLPMAAGVTMLVLLVAALTAGWPAAAGTAVSLAAGVAVAAGVARRIEGLTGDVLGAAVEVTLVVALAAATLIR